MGGGLVGIAPLRAVRLLLVGVALERCSPPDGLAALKGPAARVHPARSTRGVARRGIGSVVVRARLLRATNSTIRTAAAT